MPIYAEEAKVLQGAFRKELLALVDDHFGFMKKLLHDDDWSFVIKAQAFVEAALTELLVSHAGDKRLQSVYEKLPIASEETGKMALAKALNLLTKPQRRYIQCLSTLRNKLAHRVEYLTFSLPQYVETLPKSERDSWAKSVAWFREEGASGEYWRRAALEQPKLAIWTATFVLAGSLRLDGSTITVTRTIDEVALRTSEELYAQNLPASSG